MLFDIEWCGHWWECRTDGFGRRVWLGEKGEYGYGSIIVDRDGVEIVACEVDSLFPAKAPIAPGACGASRPPSPARL
jgi:hypothetical protein